ncbi:MAG TPA: U32 family peptidase [Rhodobacteraceae bacterium]|nr:U32 family peptidase [Paracoccaceae bacterium]
MELVCPAGTPAALRTAVEAGADAVYVGFADETNARNFPGLNFSRDELAASISFAHEHGAKVLVAINSFARAGRTELWRRAVDDAVERNADAVIVADIAIAAYMAKQHKRARLHLSVQASASSPEAIDYYCRAFGVKRVVLPRVLTVPEIAELNRQIDCETEVFVFGGLCVMAEGRCSLSSYITGKSPNMNGVCSPPSHVAYEDDGFEMVSKLAGYTINRFGEGETAGYPTLCKGRFRAGDEVGYVFEEPVSLNAAAMLPELAAAGVTALKIEGRQRGRAYVRKVVQDFRRAVDALETNAPLPAQDLTGLTEGQSETAGAYRKVWR